MRSKLVLTAAVVAATFFGASAANANPIYIGYKVGGGALTLAASGAGTANFAGVVGGVTFSVSGLGSPLLSEPDLQSTQLSVRNNTGAVSTTIKVYVSETNLTTIPAFLQIGFSNNGLSTGSLLVEAYLHDCSGGACGAAIGDDVFDTAAAGLVYSNTVAKGTGGTASVVFPATVTGPYSQTLVYTFTIPRRGISNANLSVTGIMVPEPLTLSLFGAGLAGMAAMRRRKQKVAV